MEVYPQETTVLLVKPDGVKRGLIGEIVKRIEMRGLKIIGLKMFHADAKHASAHYPNSEEWLRGMGEKSLENYAGLGISAKDFLGTEEALEIGKMIQKWNVDFLTSGPVIAVAVKGIHAIAMVRKIVGKTIPSQAEMGTIRGDFSVDSAALANSGKRAIHNVVHASGNAEEAKHELKHWFKPEEIYDYKRAEEDTMF